LGLITRNSNRIKLKKCKNKPCNSGRWIKIYLQKWRSKICKIKLYSPLFILVYTKINRLNKKSIKKIKIVYEITFYKTNVWNKIKSTYEIEIKMIYFYNFTLNLIKNFNFIDFYILNIKLISNHNKIFK